MGVSFFLCPTVHRRACVKENNHDAANDNQFLSKENCKCKEKDCSFSCNLLLDFINHLKKKSFIKCLSFLNLMLFMKFAETET